MSGCSVGTVSYWRWETEVVDALDQWNRLADAANPVVEASNHFHATTFDVVGYDQAAGDQVFIEIADNYLMTARRELPVIEWEIGIEPFGVYADVIARLTALEIEYVDSLRTAAADYNADAWNHAVELQPSLVSLDSEYQIAFDVACGYWDSR